MKTTPNSSKSNGECEIFRNEGGTTFRQLKERLEYLERWREIAVRPSTFSKNDEDLMTEEVDDVQELTKRCREVRSAMNKLLPGRSAPFEDSLRPQVSNIPGAGLGLFVHERKFSPGETLCYYYGHLHNFSSAREIEDTSYLLLVHSDVLVDPGPLPEIKARYINDPLNESYVNVKFVPEQLCSAVVATREIGHGEEVYVSYGDAYWSQQSTQGTVFYEDMPSSRQVVRT